MHYDVYYMTRHDLCLSSGGYSGRLGCTRIPILLGFLSWYMMNTLLSLECIITPHSANRGKLMSGLGQGFWAQKQYIRHKIV